MKQGNFKGFERSVAASPKAPIRMGDDVVAMCRDQADAIAHSLNFARKRFGFTQEQVAKMCDLSSKSNLSDAKKGRRNLPEKRIERFMQATGCLLLEQVIDRLHGDKRRQGKETEHDRQRAVLEMMLRDAA